MSKTRKLTRFSGFFGIACANALLASLALLQASIAGFTYFHGKIPVPRFVREKLEARLAGYGVTPRFRKLHFDLLGNIFAHDVTVHRDNGGELLVEFDTVMVDLDTPMLFIKRVLIEEIRVVRGTAYCPALYSSSGVDEPVATNLHGRFRKIDNRWLSPGLVLRVNNLAVSFHGDWTAFTRTAPRLPSDPPTTRPSPVDRYLKVCPKLLAYRPAMARFERPYLNLATARDDSTQPDVRANGGGRGGSIGGNMQFGQFRIDAPIRLPLDIAAAEPVAIALASLHWENRLTARDLTARIAPEYVPNSHTGIAANAFVSGAELNTFGFRLENFSARFAHSEGSRATGGGVAHQHGQDLRFGFDLDTSRFSGTLSVDSRLDPNPVIAGLQTQQETVETDPIVVFGVPPRVHARITLRENMQFDHARFSVRTGPLTVRGAKFDSLSAEGTVDAQHVEAARVRLEKERRAITARIEYERDTGNYRCIANGDLQPSDLTPAMREWWSHLWAPFRFSDHPLEVDVDIQSNLRTHQLRWFFGRLAANDLQYRDLSFTRLQTKAWIVENFVELFDLQARRPEGDVSGVMRWIFRDGAPIARTVDVDTEIEIADFAFMLDDDIGNVVSEITTSAPPKMKISGYQSAPDSGWAHRRDLSVQASTDAALTAFGYPLENLSFQARLLDDRFEMRRLNFGMAGGQADGTFVLHSDRNPPEIGFDIALAGANQARVFEILGWPDLIPSQSVPQPGRSEHNEISESGTLEMEITGRGPLGDIKKMHAGGTLRIEDASFGRVHLFGGLSKVLYGSGLPFASLNLDSAAGSFALEDGFLHFPAFEISGANSVIRASGSVQLSRRDLDFSVRVNYLENPDNPLLSIIGPILSPIGSALELRLRGTAQDPKWRLVINPRSARNDTASPDGPGESAIGSTGARAAEDVSEPGTETEAHAP